MARTAAASRARSHFLDDGDSVSEWIQLHARQLIIALVLVAVAAVGVWFYRSSQAIKQRNAMLALGNARASLAAGNTALALSDLQKLGSRYGGTTAGEQARVLLAQLYFAQGRYQEGISALEPLAGGGDAFRGAAVRALIAAGYEQLGRPAEAAAEYQKAAAATPFDADRERYTADAARTLAAAGDTAGAVRLWTKLAEQPAGQMVSEARVRLGELTAEPVGKSAAAVSASGTGPARATATSAAATRGAPGAAAGDKP